MRSGAFQIWVCGKIVFWDSSSDTACCRICLEHSTYGTCSFGVCAFNDAPSFAVLEIFAPVWESHYLLHKNPLKLDELTLIWWSKDKDFTKQLFNQISIISVAILTNFHTNVRVKWNYGISYPKNVKGQLHCDIIMLFRTVVQFIFNVSPAQTGRLWT